jgi:hypothetical protein
MKFPAIIGAAALAAAAYLGCSNPPTTPSGQTGTGGSNPTTGSGGSGNPTTGSGGSSQTGSGGSATGSGGDSSGSGGSTGTGGTDAGAGGRGMGGADGGPGGSGGGVAPSACPQGVLGHCNATTGPVDKYPGFTLMLAEEFDEPINLDTDPIWTWSDGGPPEGQSRFNKSQISFSGGKMFITAAQQNVPASQSFAEPNVNQQSGTAAARSVLSGEMRTKYNNYRYGRYEVRFRAPSANPGFESNAGQAGGFLSTMFVFRTPKWQDWNEIDIELEGHLPSTIAYNIINATGRNTYPADRANPDTSPQPAGFRIIDYHTYAFEWHANRIVYYVDDRMFFTFNGTANVPIPQKSAKIMMNLWIFSGTAFGNPANNKYPFKSEYEYFRFYKSSAETMYPVANPKTMLPADDVDFSKNNSGETVYP